MDSLQALFFFSIASYVISTVGFLRLSKTPYLLLLLAFSQLAYILINAAGESYTRSFFALLFLNGPILYFILQNNLFGTVSLKNRLIHLLPFILILFKDLAIDKFGTGERSFSNSVELSAALGSIFQIIYASCIFGQQQNRSNITTDAMFILIKQLSILLIINATINILVQLNALGFKVEFGFNGSHLSYLPFMLSIALLIRELFAKRAEILFDKSSSFKESNEDYDDERYKYSPMAIETLQEIERNIYAYLTEKKAYLQPDITMAALSQSINIPKNHISQTLNTHIGKSFYRLIAEYRIEYALKLLQNNKNLTIEALAYECGFNSLSTFNRYFKEIMGTQPSAYIKITEI